MAATMEWVGGPRDGETWDGPAIPPDTPVIVLTNTIGPNSRPLFARYLLGISTSDSGLDWQGKPWLVDRPALVFDGWYLNPPNEFYGPRTGGAGR